jgi:hypothetical protein
LIIYVKQKKLEKTMEKIIIILIFILITLFAVAQEPAWQWATNAGGTGFDYGYKITIDNAGNSYVTGFFQDTATFGSHSLTSNGNTDIFVAKIDDNGVCLWATKAGGSSFDEGHALTIDSSGNCYITGFFRGTATFGSCSLTGSNNSEMFIAKMDSEGSWLWASQAGGNIFSSGEAIDSDEFENIYITGQFVSTVSFGSHPLTSNGGGDIFVTKMDSDGNWLWASQAGGSHKDVGYGITIDNGNNCYIAGSFRNTASFNSYSLTSSGLDDIFIAKMDSNGNWLWALRAGGSDVDEAKSISVDSSANSYITGWFYGVATFGSQTFNGSGRDVFSAKIDESGNWVYVATAGGSSYDYGCE